MQTGPGAGEWGGWDVWGGPLLAAVLPGGIWGQRSARLCHLPPDLAVFMTGYTSAPRASQST